MTIRIRVGAIVIDDNKLLLVEHHKGDESYWLLPGGGVGKEEILHQALKREIKEELSLLIEPQELAFVCESIAAGDRHILHLYFKAKVTGGSLKVNPDYRLKSAAFFQKDQIKNLNIRPKINKVLIDLFDGKVTSPPYLGNLWH